MERRPEIIARRAAAAKQIGERDRSARGRSSNPLVVPHSGTNAVVQRRHKRPAVPLPPSLRLADDVIFRNEHDPEKWELVFRKRSCSTKELHDPEKWELVFRKDHAPQKSCMIRKSGRRFSNHAPLKSQSDNRFNLKR
jgi:hypothetical protein